MKRTLFIAIVLLQTCITTVMHSSEDPVIQQVLFDENLDEIGNTYLHRAKTSNIVNHLLKKGFDVNARNIQGQSPLHIVQDPSAVQALIDANAEINAVDIYGNTPIFYLDNIEKLKILAENGAEINAKNKSQQNAFYYQDNSPLAAAFILYGSDYDESSYPEIFQSKEVKNATRYRNNFKDLETARKMYYKGLDLYPEIKIAFDQYLNNQPLSLQFLLSNSYYAQIMKNLFTQGFIEENTNKLQRFKKQDTDSPNRKKQDADRANREAKSVRNYDAFNSKTKREYGW